MSFVEKILPYERDAFLWLNEHHTPFWDSFMWMYSGKLVWLPAMLSLLFIIVYKIKWKEAMLLIVCAILIGVLCDFVSASVIKPFFERLRPTHHPDFEAFVTTVNGYKGGRFGFISNHAANGFGVVTFFSLIFRYRLYTICAVAWALITCYSRIYLGVHFISDVVGGALWGILSGCLVYYIYLTSRHHILKVPKEDLKTPLITTGKVNILLTVMALTVTFITIYSLISNIPL